jgi:hypothetical protein
MNYPHQLITPVEELPKEANLIVDGYKYLEIGYGWRERDGSVSGVKFHGPWSGTKAELNERARHSGWPGHSGTRWDYLKADLRSLFRA